MKKIFFLLLTICLIGTACEKDSKKDHNLIASNLSKNGSSDLSLLVGNWDFVKFGYTSDGNKILDRTTISKAYLKIPAAPTSIENGMNKQWMLHSVNSIWYSCSISNNLIELTFCGSTYVQVAPLHEENEISFALENAYSFVIKGDGLIIYFIGIEDKNLLILKKQ
jgi:hypothetical protein